MMRTCVVLDGKVINIGEWDYQYVEIDGQQIAQNPLPEGAVIEEREFEYDPERGWYEVGAPPVPTAQERIDALEEALLLLLMEG